MQVKPRPPTLSPPRGKDIAAATVVLLFIFSVGMVGAAIFTEVKLQPIDGRAGVPQLLNFPWCGRTFQLTQAGGWTLARVEDQQTLHGPTILEPTIGKIPLAALFTSCPDDLLIWLHVGSDDYAEYELVNRWDTG